MRFSHVDAFVAPGFLGNAAAVAVVDAFAADEVLARAAQTNGVPATAFVQPLSDGTHHIRWFTPSESDFCGHGTLAAAHTLYEGGVVAREAPIRFHSRAGELVARMREGWIALDLPALALTQVQTHAQLEGALGAKVLGVYDARGRVLVELESEQHVKALQPDVQRLHATLGQSAIVTARAEPPYDFVSRCFRKEDEDPVTGSAHCALTPFWSQRLNKRAMRAYQASARGGVLRVEDCGERVIVSGQAVTSSPAQ